MAFRRLARPSLGISLMRQIYTTVAIQKITYTANVWYMPVHTVEGGKKKSGMVCFSWRMATVQRLATMAIMGMLWTMAMEVLDLHADLLPVNLLIHKVCFRLAAWLASLPITHPLGMRFWARAKQWAKTHRSPLHELVFMYNMVPENMEKIHLVRFAAMLRG